MKTIPKIHIKDAVINRAISQNTEGINYLLGNGLIKNIITITLAVGDNVINHKMRTTPIGWILVDTTTGGTDLYRVSWDDKVLVLNSSAISTITLLIF